MVGQYRILDLLGEGGMGAVWKAQHTTLGHTVAIKTLRRERLPSDPAKRAMALARFQREGRALALIRHENVIRVTDLGVVDELLYLVMDFLVGEDLDKHMQRSGPMGVAELCDILVPVCAGIAAAHEVGIVHRDVKPENIFLVREPGRRVVPKVLDFGISRIDDTQDGLTGTSALLGTPRYMSPEQAQGARNAGPASDQYSLGVVLYRGAVGQCPVEESALLAQLQRVVQGVFAPPRTLRPDLPVAFEQVVMRALATDPARRYASVRELGAALIPFASELTRAMYADMLGAVAGSVPPPSPSATLPLDNPVWAPPLRSETTMAGAVHVVPTMRTSTTPPSRLAARAGGVAAMLVTAALVVGAYATTHRPPAVPVITVVSSPHAPTPVVAPAAVSPVASQTPTRAAGVAPAAPIAPAPVAAQAPQPSPTRMNPVTAPSRAPTDRTAHTAVERHGTHRARTVPRGVIQTQFPVTAAPPRGIATNQVD